MCIRDRCTPWALAREGPDDPASKQLCTLDSLRLAPLDPPQTGPPRVIDRSNRVLAGPSER
eukprot:6893292-Alexandrium_andersonii.AAC.1